MQLIKGSIVHLVSFVIAHMSEGKIGYLRNCTCKTANYYTGSDRRDRTESI